MKNHKPNFWFSEKDEKLFEYLHQVKVATLAQINRDVYSYEKFKSLYRRMTKFEKSGFLTQTSHIAYPKQKLVSLGRKGFDDFIGNGDEQIIELRSDSICHDVTLVDIRHRLSSSEKVIDYYTENSLQTWAGYRNSPTLRPYVEVRCDAAIKAHLSNADVFLAVEYEASRKYSSRIAEVVAKYYNTEDIPAVLYVCANQEILQRHVEEEKRSFAKYDSRIYYSVLENLICDRTLAFKNRAGEVLRLGQKVGE